jgi:hypothetical protein
MWKKLMMLLNHRLTFDRWGAMSAHVGRFYFSVKEITRSAFANLVQKM